MAEIADMMIDGTLCSSCGCELEGGGEGFPRYCDDCRGSDISDETDEWAEHKKEIQERHAEWWENNTKILKGSGLPFRVASRESYIFREIEKPKVDFYPSTGRWSDVGTGRTYSGGATSFINWYKKQ